MLARRRFAPLVLALVTLGPPACSRPSDAPASEPELPDGGAVATPRGAIAVRSTSRVVASARDGLAAAMRRAHFSFFAAPAGDAFEAGHRAHAIHASAKGVRFTPASAREPSRAGAALELAAPSITRGERNLVEASAGAPSSLHVEAGGALAIDRGLGLVERLENDERGLEQSWRFDRAPAGEGDLVVRQRVLGERFVGADGAGLHFADATSGAGVRYGHATFVDFGGVRTDVPARWVGGDTIELRVPASVLGAARWPAVLDPTVSAEKALDTAVNTTWGSSSVTAPLIAYGNGVYVAVWATYGWAYACRLGVDGSRIDATPVRFAIPSNVGIPTLGFDGTRFLLAFVVVGGARSSLSALPFHADATTLDVASASISTLLSSPDVVSAPASQATVAGVPLIAFTQIVGGGPTHAFLSRLSFSGGAVSLLDPTNDTSTANEPGMVIAGNATNGWAAKPGSLTLAKINVGSGAPSLTPVSTLPFGAPVQLVATGSTAWLSMGAGIAGQADVVFPVASTGTIGAGIALPGAGSTYAPLLAYDGTYVRTAWANAAVTGIQTLRLNATTGAFVETTPTTLPLVASPFGGTSWLAALAATPTGHAYYAWVQSIGGASPVLGTRVEGATAPDAPGVVVSNGPNHETNLAAATDGSTVLVSWLDDRNFLTRANDLLAIRLRLDGTPIDTSAFLVDAAPPAGFAHTPPQVAWDGKTFVVAYGLNATKSSTGSGSGAPTSLLAVRVKADGSVLDAPARTLATAATGDVFSFPLIAGGSGSSLVGWTDAAQALHAVRVVDGAAIDASPILVGTGAPYPSTIATPMALGFSGGTFFGAWFSVGAGGLVAARVGTDGSTPDGAGKLLVSTATQPATLSIATAPTGVMLAWDMNASSAFDVFGLRAKIDGTTLSALDATPRALASAINAQQKPSVAFDGAAFVLAWEDGRNGGDDLYGTRVLPDGTNENGLSGFALSTDTTVAEVAPVVVAAGGKSLALYQRSDAQLGSQRVATRAIAFAGDAGSACTSAAQCETGSCVDGVCCDRACAGQCEACDVKGKEGHCTAVSGAPHGARTACSGAGLGTTCGITCNGVDATKCNYPAVGSVCSGNSCATGIEKHASICDGAGKCYDIPRACGAYGCSATGESCNSVCTAASDCAVGFICVTNACVPAKGLGDPCTSSATCGPTLSCTDGVCCGSTKCDAGSSCDVVGFRGQCTKVAGTACGADGECGSGHCVDGVCCESACAGQCAACDVPGYLGKCIPVVGHPHGTTRTACGDGGAGGVCATPACDGKDTTKCAGLENGAKTQCKAAICDVDKFTAASTCDGLGACATPDTHSCAPYTCTANGCRSDCVGDGDCSAGNTCTAGRCVPKATAKCSDDALSSIGPDGATQACPPFRCGASGLCIKQCSSTSDCAAGATCDPSTQLCVASSTADPGSGGGCATNGGGANGANGSAGTVALVAMALAAIGKRALRRRSR
jgi:hypothetical protein